MKILSLFSAVIPRSELPLNLYVMIKQGFEIGDNAWYCTVWYDLRTEAELNEAYMALLEAGCPDYRAREACMVLSQWNNGYTFTDYANGHTLMFIGKATSAEEAYDTVAHERKHAVEHISNAYGVDPKSEEAAYLQGEVGRQMLPAVALLVCPMCHHIIRFR